jgi:hypothetical protein
VTTLRNRIFGAVVGLGLAAMAAFSPLAAQAQVVPGTQNIYQDVNQVAAAEHEAFLIQAIATICAQRATDYQLQNLCFGISQTAALDVRNARWTIFYLTGTWPNNPRLTATEQTELGVLENQSIGPLHGEEALVAELTVSLIDNGPVDINGTIVEIAHGLDAFPIAGLVTDRCATQAFTSVARHYCASLHGVFAYQENLFTDYVTFTFGTPFTPPGPPNPFGV